MEGITLEPKRNNKRARGGAHGHLALALGKEEEPQNTRNILPPTPTRTKDYRVKDPID